MHRLNISGSAYSELTTRERVKLLECVSGKLTHNSTTSLSKEVYLLVNLYLTQYLGSLSNMHGCSQSHVRWKLSSIDSRSLLRFPVSGKITSRGRPDNGAFEIFSTASHSTVE